MSLTTSLHAHDGNAFRHEALLYAGEAEFLKSATAFIRDGVAAGEPTLVVVDAAKIDRLRAALGSDAQAVHFADMAKVGLNPARIIPAWEDFVNQYVGEGRRLRGIGEPIWPERPAAELIESQRHETLLNVAFDRRSPWWLLCPYDIDALDPAVVEEAARSHPFVMRGADHWESPRYVGAQGFAGEVLPQPPASAAELIFDDHTLASVRGLVARQAAAAGLSPAGTADLVLAVNEVATNSLRHGGGQGSMRTWQDQGVVICEIRDAGHISDLMADRQRPASDAEGSRGLWLVNHLADLVQLRSSSSGTVVRLHKRPN